MSNPTHSDILIIRAAAGLEVGRQPSSSLHLEVTKFWSTEQPNVTPSINALAVTFYPGNHERDTDIAELLPLSAFTDAPLPSTPAIFEFNIFTKHGDITDRLGIVLAHYEAGRLVMVKGGANNTMWSKRS